jgi:hypothetical protein
MGRRKPFIDKKSATTYNLLYGDADEQSQANETVNSKDAARPQMGRDFDPFPPEEMTWDLPNNKRKEIVELGLPDDGYDYLQHLRDPAANVFSSHDPNVPAAEGELLLQLAVVNKLCPLRLSSASSSERIRIKALPRLQVPECFCQQPMWNLHPKT